MIQLVRPTRWRFVASEAAFPQVLE